MKKIIKELIRFVNRLRNFTFKKYYYKYAGKPTVDRKHNLETLKEICKHLKGIEYVIFYGTLLGFHRERNIIQNDDDVDFLVKKDYRDEIIAILTKLNYRLEYTAQNFVQGSKISGNKSVECVADFYFYEDLDDNFLLDKWNFFGIPNDSSLHMHIPKNIIYPIKNKEIQGFSCNVPYNIEECCRFLYGDRFMTPVKKGDYTIKMVCNKPSINYKR
jgi:hypothetical protein